MEYREFEPTLELSAFVKCYWTLDAEKQDNPQRQTIIPDGCMEMIFHYGDKFLQYVADDNTILQPQCFVIGQLTQPLEIEPTGTTGIFSVRFHPQGFLPFATMPIKEMENTAIALENLFGEDGMKLGQQVVGANSSDERIGLIESFLLSRLVNTETVDGVVKSTVEVILSFKGQLSVEELSQQTKYNRRQLERKFSSSIGLSPKQLSKTIRLQAVLRILLDKKYTNLTELAYEGAYYDQAHFIRDFKELTGFTPKEFYGDHFKMTSFFFGKD